MHMQKISYYNPATGEALGQTVPTTPNEVQEVFEKSKLAFAQWSQTPIRQRVEHLAKGRHWLLQHIDEIADAISLNNGKPRVEALMADVGSVIQSFLYHEKNTEKLLADEPISIWQYLPNKRAVLTFSPLGVVGVISPWNYPFSLPLGEVISALAAGNCVILKPSEVTGLVNQKIQQLMNACNLPEGVFQMIEGEGEVGAALTKLPLSKIAFTGSVATGKKVMRAAADNLVPISLELGGKDPAIILEDANLDVATSGVLAGGFYNNGQTCASVERLLVHKSIESEFILLLQEKAKRLRVGPSVDYNNDIGPITYAPQKQVIKSQLDQLEGSSSKLYDGKSPFLPPVIIKTSNKDLIWKEETFGPVIAYDTFTTDEEAIVKANDTQFGLASVVWGQTDHANKVARQLYAGTVVINDAPFTNAIPALPWGGVKNSGIGRVHGKEGLRDMCLTRVITTDIQGQARQLWWFPYSKNHYLFMKAFTLFLGTRGINKITWLFKMAVAAIKTEKRL